MTDEKLAQLAAGGDERAFESLYARYEDIIHGKANAPGRFIPGGESKDLFQEGALGFVGAVYGYDKSGGALFATFAERCIENAMFNAIKAAGRNKHKPLNDAKSIDISNSDDEGNESDSGESALPVTAMNKGPETAFLSQELSAYLEKNIPKKLSDLELNIWALFISGEKPAQIAARLGKKAKSISNALERGKKKIAALLEEYENAGVLNTG